MFNNTLDSVNHVAGRDGTAGGPARVFVVAFAVIDLAADTSALTDDGFPPYTAAARR